MRSRMLLSITAGTAGGAIGWFLQETLINYNSLVHASALPNEPPVIYSMTHTQVMILMMCVGGLPGLLLGCVDGVVTGDRRRLVTGGVVGLIGGFLLGSVGYSIGSVIFSVLGGTETPSAVGFLQNVVARGFGWAPLGLGIGAGAALSTLSPKRIGQGAVGGFLGGFFGGIVFDFASFLSAVPQTIVANRPIDVGGPGRAIGFTAIGALTGFFIGLVQELMKDAWVKVLAGRNEGRDFQLDKPVNILGRDERCTVPLFGDPSVGVQHAAIQLDTRTKRRTIVDAGTPSGTIVNGQQIPPGGQVLLQDGDMIQVGSHRILFREKATTKKVGTQISETPRSSSVVGSPMPSHLCPYCGGPRDAGGYCRCTPVPAGQAAAPSIAVHYGAPATSATTMSAAAPVLVQHSTAAVEGRLTAIDAPGAGQVFFITAPNITVGRDALCNMVITDDTTVSRNHAQITVNNGVYQVTDTNSANGTYINGQRITAAQLSAGDVIQFGNSRYRFE